MKAPTLHPEVRAFLASRRSLPPYLELGGLDQADTEITLWPETVNWWTYELDDLSPGGRLIIGGAIVAVYRHLQVPGYEDWEKWIWE